MANLNDELKMQEIVEEDDTNEMGMTPVSDDIDVVKPCGKNEMNAKKAGGMLLLGVVIGVAAKKALDVCRKKYESCQIKRAAKREAKRAAKEAIQFREEVEEN